jgi:hypothetical protein
METLNYITALAIAAAVLMAYFSPIFAVRLAESLERLAVVLRAHASATAGARATYAAIYREIAGRERGKTADASTVDANA